MNKTWEENKKDLAQIAIKHGPLPYKGRRESLIALTNKIRDTSLSIEERKEYLFQAAERMFESPASLQKKLGVSLI